jgi:hypothetical protein
MYIKTALYLKRKSASRALDIVLLKCSGANVAHKIGPKKQKVLFLHSFFKIFSTKFNVPKTQKKT